MSGAMGRPTGKLGTARGVRGKIAAGAMALAMIAPGVAGAASAVDLYYERALMLAANARCGLFTPPISTALAAAAAQARGAALRAGVANDGLAEVARRAAARAAGAACNSPDLTTA